MKPGNLNLSGAEARRSPRRRTRLQSAKLFNEEGEFICYALIQDVSEHGRRLLLDADRRLPVIFGLYEDATGEFFTGFAAWRRERNVGVNIVAKGPPSPLKNSTRTALAGRYYGVRG